MLGSSWSELHHRREHLRRTLNQLLVGFSRLSRELDRQLCSRHERWGGRHRERYLEPLVSVGIHNLYRRRSRIVGRHRYHVPRPRYVTLFYLFFCHQLIRPCVSYRPREDYRVKRSLAIHLHARSWLTNEYPGLIRERNWYGKNGMENLLTIKKPKQSIPTFEQTIALLMKVSLVI
jgi:hypothetical protein